MVYSDVINQGLILPKKQKYTIRDYNALRERGFSVSVARFICISSAIYHDTDLSKSINDLQRLKLQAMIAA